MKSVAEQYQQIQEELELNQQEYKDKQGMLLKKLTDLQKNCKHHNSKFIEELGTIKCLECSKILP